MDVLVWILIGLFAGLASGLAGIGGGVIIVPALVFLMAFPQHLAQGTSLFAIVFTAMAGTGVSFRNKRVDLRNALIIGAFGAVASFGASQVANQLDGDLLQRLFGVLVLVSGGRMAWQVWGPTNNGQAPEEA